MSRDYYGPGAPFLYTAPDSVSPAALVSGMDCLPLRSPTTAPGPFHYLINEHSKSLIALQELQHEVGALLEFRDLVIETFPNLRTKLASSTPSTMTATSAGHSSSNIPVSVRRDWEPGVRVRRKLHHKDDASSSSFGRSRSNSHSSGKQQSSAVSVVQDSGFSTETSSKETAAPEDELCHLLDIIHRKGTRLRDEVEALQGMLHEQNAQHQQSTDFQRSLLHASVDDVRQLRRERDLLLDRVAEMEAETLASKVHTSRLQSDLESLLVAKQDLETQLKTVITQKCELNNRIHDMHVQFVKSDTTTTNNNNNSNNNNNTVGMAASNKTADRQSANRLRDVESLDTVLGDKVPLVKNPDARRIAAILLEHDPLVLQKHLLSATVQNQLLQQRLELIIRMKKSLGEKFDKAKEENDDLRFQLEDRNIELEGTRARVRLLEQLQLNKPIDSSPDIIPDRLTSRSEITTASMKAMSPLPMNMLQMDHSSSTESAHDQQQEQMKKSVGNGNDSTSRRKPSKIPLPGVKSYAAPKPPIQQQQQQPRSRSSEGGASLTNKTNSRRSNHHHSHSIGASGSLRSGNMSGMNTRRVSASAVSTPGDVTKVFTSLCSDLYCPDSLDSPIGCDLPPTISSNSQTLFQTANMFLWNTEQPMSDEYYDSIDTNASFRLENSTSLLDSTIGFYQHGEALADCDSLEKQRFGLE